MYNTTTMTKFVVMPKRLRVYKECAKLQPLYLFSLGLSVTGVSRHRCWFIVKDLTSDYAINRKRSCNFFPKSRYNNNNNNNNVKDS
jgi:hypothetical protein